MIVERTAGNGSTENPAFRDDPGGEESPTRAPRAGVLRFARMTGSSICGRDAAPWVTDFLNAAYYRRPVREREVGDLRLAFSILTTYWYCKPDRKRLRASDLVAFHRAFGEHRFDTDATGRGVLSREQLERGGSALLGDWFSDAYADDARRGWGIAFPTVGDKAAYDPELRLRLARLGEPCARARSPQRTGVAHVSARRDALG